MRCKIDENRVSHAATCGVDRQVDAWPSPLFVIFRKIELSGVAVLISDPSMFYVISGRIRKDSHQMPLSNHNFQVGDKRVAFTSSCLK
jgi:hypothetical protein